MTAELRELFRLKVLQLIEACGSTGIRANSLGIQLAAAGYTVKAEEISNAVTYLSDAGFITEVAQAISPELKRWRIVKAGWDFLAQQGLA